MARRSCSATAFTIAALFFSVGAAAQQTFTSQSSPGVKEATGFEVASIKPNRSGSSFVNIVVHPGGRFTATNANLRDLIRAGYDIPGWMLSGGPTWMNTDRFDIVAKAPGNPTQRETLPMIRALLADRFKLVVRRDTHDVPAFALRTAKSDGRLGSELRPAATPCTEPTGDPTAPPPSAADPPPCVLANLPGRLTGRGIRLETLTHSLTGWVTDHREVKDQTGLTGRFDVDLEWTPESAPLVAPDGPPVPAIDPNGVSLFTAVQEQLGLKLEPIRDMIDLVVVESASQPTDN